MGLTVYWPSMHGPFVFDDVPNIEYNRHLRLKTLSLGELTDAGFKGPNSQRPVAKVSFALNYAIHEYRTFGYHLVNVLIHVATALFIFLFFIKTFAIIRVKGISDRLVNANGDGRTDGWLIPCCIAMLWMLHPLQSQTVSYIVQRMTGLATLFYILSFLCYFSARESIGGRSRAFYASGCVLAGLLAVGSKEIAVTLPFFIFLFEWFFYQDMDWRWLRRKFGWLLVVGVLVAATTLIFTHGHPIQAIEGSYHNRDFTLAERLLTQPRVIILYLSQVLVPHPSRLNLDHGITVSERLVDPPTTIIALAAIAGLALFAILSARKSRFLAFGIVWFFGNLAGESSVFGLEMVFEHRMYLPSIMVIAVIVLLIRGVIRNIPIFLSVMGCIGILCATWTHERNQVWTDELLLWSDAARKSPDNYRPFYNVGIILSEKGLSEQSISAFEKSIALKPTYAEAYNNLGFEYFKVGNNEKAVRHLREAMRLSPSLEEPYINMATYYERKNMPSKAFDSIQNGLEKVPESFQLLTYLGALFMREGDFQAASVQFAKALKLRPESSEALNNLGVALIQIGRKDEAVRLFQEAIRNDPNNRDTIRNLSMATQN